jgi:predicted ATPase with chaperone activity
MNAIEALMQRMDQAPEEFVDDLTWRGTRWEEVTDIMVAESNMKPRVFTQEEIDAYLNKLSAITRKNIEEHVCVELLNPLRTTADQLDLFGHVDPRAGVVSGSLLTVNQIQNDAMKILQSELDKSMHDAHMDQHIALQRKLFK